LTEVVKVPKFKTPELAIPNGLTISALTWASPVTEFCAKAVPEIRLTSRIKVIFFILSIF
jgi:hypothetical protein